MPDGEVKKKRETVKIAVITGDKRTHYMAEELRKCGFAVKEYKLTEEKEKAQAKELEEAGVIAGGVPFHEEERIFSFLQPGRFFFGGALSEVFMERCREKRVLCFDFMREESIAVFNAIATAEGTIMEAIREKETNLHGSRCLVLGYGRCGKILCSKLKGLSAEVTAVSRDVEERAWAGALGMETLTLSGLPDRLREYEYIFNTIPKVVLDKALLEKTAQDALILDIASGVGGVDYEEAARRKIKALHLQGIPGKYAAEASGRCLAAFIMRKVVLL